MVGLLIVIGVLLGLFATGAGVFTIWVLRRQADKQRHAEPDLVGNYFLRWTVWDYAVLLLFITGLIIQLADIIAMYRDRVLYPDYHFAYLLSGFVFTLLGMIFMAVRLAVVLKFMRFAGTFAPHDHHQPNQTDPAEQRIQGGQ